VSTGGGGGGAGAAAGGAPFAGFGGGFNGGDAGAGAGVAGIETFGAAASDPRGDGRGDPEDYFTRLGLSDSLFKTVEKALPGEEFRLGLKTRCKSRVFFGKRGKEVKGVRPTSQADKPEKKAGHFAWARGRLFLSAELELSRRTRSV